MLVIYFSYCHKFSLTGMYISGVEFRGAAHLHVLNMHGICQSTKLPI